MVMKKKGYVRVEVDGIQYTLDEEIPMDKNVKHDINIIVDRLVMKESIKTRLADSIETALELGNGIIIIEILEEGEVLYVDIPERDYVLLKKELLDMLSEGELSLLEEIATIKRKKNPAWGLVESLITESK